ncbi:MAG: endo-1,4-beta-xylanase, partial [Treponema sp.]|nr:endo-1,4-beta-xylanase [Treponema sp.]
ARLFNLYREYAAYIKRVTMWGIDDHNSWLSAGNPCLFDRYLIPKKAFNAVFSVCPHYRQTLFNPENRGANL